MTQQEFISLIKHPQDVKPVHARELKELVDLYPYFTPVRMLYLKALQQGNDIIFNRFLDQSVVYASDRRWLYYFIYPEKQKKTGKRKLVRQEVKSGDYFDMLDVMEKDGQDVNQSLRLLAERLKAARIQVVSAGAAKKVKKTTPPVVVENASEDTACCSEDDYAERVRLLMRDKKYEEALVLLRKLNLNNPKKSIYFADQIRFIEKILENSKK